MVPVSNVDFLRSLVRGHSGRPWVCGFSEDPGKANGAHWSGRLARTAEDIPNGDTNSYFSVGLMPEGAERRSKEEVAAVVALVLDDISPEKIPTAESPTWVLETSPKNYQVGFALHPGQDPKDVDRLVRAMTAVGYAAADKSGNNVVRYVRLPNGVNTKARVIEEAGCPFPCTLEDFTPEARYTVEEISRIFRVGLDARSEAHSSDGAPSGDPHDIAAALSDIARGEALHESILTTAASLVAQGVHQHLAEQILRGAMESTPEADRDERWQARYDDIQRTVASAGKFAKEDEKPQWPEVEPLGAGFTEPLPFPLDALPATIREAVSDFRDYGKQPLGLIASCALASASVACQGHADIARDSVLKGPMSLFLLPIGESGERKSAIDNAFGKEFRRWEEDRQRDAVEEIKRAKGKHKAWSAKMKGLERVAGELASGKVPTQYKEKVDAKILLAQIEEEIETLSSEEPDVPSEPQLLFSDTTIEAFAQRLHRGLPIASLWEDEAGAVLGSVGLSNDRLLGFITGLSKLWDSKPISQTRASVDSRSTRGKRVSANLMIQPFILAKLAALMGGTARNTGFLARLLICEPKSTMGTRDYTEPGELASLNRFNRRIAELLRQDFPFREGSTRELDPPVLKLSPAAHEVWKKYYTQVERDLSPEGDLHEVRDFASKSAEQAARIAGVFHVFEIHQETGEMLVSAETMEMGVKVAWWFLVETFRVLNIRDVPEQIADASALLEWMLERGKASFTASEIVNFARPRPLRTNKARRDRAIDCLLEHGSVVLKRSGKAKTYHVNPALMGGE